MVEGSEVAFQTVIEDMTGDAREIHVLVVRFVDGKVESRGMLGS